MIKISINAVNCPGYLITQPPFWQGPYRTFYPQIARMFTRLLFLLLSLLRQPVGEARDGLADLILRYCEAQTHELAAIDRRSEEHTSELQSLMRNSYAVLCLKKQTNRITQQ